MPVMDMLLRFQTNQHKLQDGMLPERRHNSTSIFMTKMSLHTHTHTPAILIKHTHTHTCSDLLMCKISMSLGTIALFEERFLFFLYEFRPQPNAFKASLFPLLQQRCSSCNLILVKSKSFGPISPTPLLWLGTKTKMKPVGKHILQQFLCEHISEHHRPLGEFHFFVN